MTAARSGSVDTVNTLVARGADVNRKEAWRGQNALMWAAAEGHAEVIRALVAHGADIRARSNGGFLPPLFFLPSGPRRGRHRPTLAGRRPHRTQPRPRRAA